MGKSSRTSSAVPPPSTWADPGDEVADELGLPRPQAAGPVARLSASVSAASSPSVSRSPTASATASMVAGSSRSRRVATSGSSRWWRTIACEHRDVVGREAHAGPDRGEQLDADLGVVARVALADVVQQRAEHEQVGPVGAGDERRRRWRTPP